MCPRPSQRLSDNCSNSSLNAEYVVLKNVTTLGAGRGTKSSTHRYWGSGNYVWNNTGGTATLKTPSGTAADTCKWTSVGSGYKNC